MHDKQINRHTCSRARSHSALYAHTLYTPAATPPETRARTSARTHARARAHTEKHTRTLSAPQTAEHPCSHTSRNIHARTHAPHTHTNTETHHLHLRWRYVASRGTILPPLVLTFRINTSCLRIGDRCFGNRCSLQRRLPTNIPHIKTRVSARCVCVHRSNRTRAHTHTHKL